MNSLKKIAAVSGIVFALALLAAIIATPFAVSSGIDFYNKILDEAEKQKDEHWFDTAVDSAVKELTLADSGYYGMITIQQSPDNQIHILNQDQGFSYISPELQIRGEEAELNFRWINDPKLTEDNIMQWLSSEFYSGYSRQSIIQLPASASLHFAEENVNDLYHNVDLQYTGFANYEELQAQLDGWSAVLEARDAYNNYLYEVDEQLNQIQNMRYPLAEAAESADDANLFQLEHADEYVEIKERRSNLLKRSYNLRKQYGTQSEEDLDSAYLELNKVIVELCEYEKQYDLLSAKVAEAQFKLYNGEYNEEQFSRVADSCYTQQVDLDLQIGKLRDKLENYLRQEFVEMGADQDLPNGAVYPSEVPPTDSTEVVVETPVTVVTPADPEVAEEVPVPVTVAESAQS